MFINCFLGALIGFSSMLLNCCLIIDFKEKSKFMLKIWRMLAFKVNSISALFKIVLIKSIQGPLLEEPEYKVEYNLDFKHWYFKFMFDALSGKLFLLSTIVLAVWFHIEGKVFKIVYLNDLN